MSLLARLLLTLTGFAPILVVYAIVAVFDADYLPAALCTLVAYTLALVCKALLNYMARALAGRRYTTESVEPADSEIVSFLLIYLLPLVFRNLSEYDWLAWSTIVLLFCVLVAMSYGYHFNPTMVCFGFHFYKVREADGVPHLLVTRRMVYKTGEELSVIKLSAYLLLERSSAQGASSRSSESS